MVIAIIAVLVSILVPSLQKARELARRALCATNQRTTLTVLAVYEADLGTYPFHIYDSAWGTMPGNQYTEGWTGGAGPPSGERLYAGSYSHSYMANSPADIYLRMIDAGYADSYGTMICSSTYGEVTLSIPGTTVALNHWHHGNHWASYSTAEHWVLPDGKHAKFTPFFSYNGPGVNGVQMMYSFTNPLALHEGERITCVRPSHGYKWRPVTNFVDTRVEGSFRLIGCPTQIQTDNDVWIPYSPHGRLTRIGIGNTFACWDTTHFRNFGYTDGHVAGGDVLPYPLSPEF